MKKFASLFLLGVLSIGIGGAMIGCSYHENRYAGQHRHWDGDGRYYGYRDDHYGRYDYRDRDRYRDRGPDRWRDRDWR